MSFRIVPPVVPFRGLRGRDAYGNGAYGASRDGGARQHLGLDFLAQPDDRVISPINGSISHIGVAYADSDLGSIHIDGHDGIHTIKLLYAKCRLFVGATIGQGDLVGVAQNVAVYWEAKEPRGGHMQNHVHCELRAGGLPLDPAQHLDPSLLDG